MNFADLITKGKMVLKEDAGSEGFAYIVKFKGELKETDENVVSVPDGDDFTVEDKKDGQAKICFKDPCDCGLAAMKLKDLGIEVLSLELVF